MRMIRWSLRVGLVLVACTVVFAQDQRPAFDAASIKPVAPIVGPFLPGTRRTCPVDGCGGPGTGDPGHWAFAYTSLNWLIQAAYSLRPYQLEGPGWLDAARFDLDTTVPQGATREEARLMLQNLLADRFQLKVHRTTKELPIYALLVAKGGPKMRESAQRPPGADRGRGTVIRVTKQFEFDAMPMAMFADTLADEVDRPVVDMTGLTTTYEIRLNFAPLKVPAFMRESAATARDQESGPALFTALQEQLGLKLESRKGPVTMVVVDSALKQPTEN
jgi:uncharacterized protein (TIGR03435 family)